MMRADRPWSGIDDGETNDCALLTNEPETQEKRAIGALWECQSGGEGLFLMAEKTIDGKDVRRQLIENIAA